MWAACILTMYGFEGARIIGRRDRKTNNGANSGAFICLDGKQIYY